MSAKRSFYPSKSRRQQRICNAALLWHSRVESAEMLRIVIEKGKVISRREMIDITTKAIKSAILGHVLSILVLQRTHDD